MNDAMPTTRPIMRSTMRLATPVRPRDAATLVVVRSGARGSLCLMGRRHADSEFLPGYYVFPGGAVERPWPSSRWLCCRS